MAAPPSARSSSTTRRTLPAARPNLSRAARRGIRQAAAIARKEDFHSFRIHTDGTVTWTLMHSKPESKPESKDKGKQAAPPEEPSQHALKSRARAAEHAVLMQRAHDFRTRSIIRWWSRTSAPPSTQQQHAPQHDAAAGARGAAEGDAMRTTLSDASDVGSPPTAHRDKRERVLSPPDPARALGDGLPGARARAAQPTQADAGAGEQALHLVERAGADSAGVDEEGRRRAQAPSMSAHACATHGPGGGAPQVMQPPCMPRVAASAVACQGPPGDGFVASCAAAPQQHPQQYRVHMESFLEHIRAHEYPQHMSYAMMQGMSREEAQIAWNEYERKRVGNESMRVLQGR